MNSKPLTTRLDHDKLVIEMATLVGMRSTCPRNHVGALIMRERRIVSMGYNGAPPGEKHCTEVGCELVQIPKNQGHIHYTDHDTIPTQKEWDQKNMKCIRTVHAEANAIVWAARHGIETEDTILITTMSPCYECAKLIIAAGISRVVFNVEYRDSSGIDLLDQALIPAIAYEVPSET